MSCVRVFALLAVLVAASLPARALPCDDVDGDTFSPDGGACGAVDCDDGNAAVHPGAAEVCNGVDDDCDLTVDNDPDASASCANDCTDTAACVGGSCITTPLVCDDSEPCTVDNCVLGTGCVFTNQPNGLSCSDGNPCTGEETCSGGHCGNPPDLDCDDGNACTNDSCAPPNGCRNTPIPGCCTSDADCADVSACTSNERCIGGACLSDPVDCDDDEACTSDSCNPTDGCHNVSVVNGIACGDGNVCNGIETCQSGSCTPGTPPGCNDGNPCTVDGCDSLAGCTVQELPGCCADDSDCTDASACTVNERCVDQACISDPVPCNDNNPCTTDGCSPATGCTFTPVPNGQSCGDNNFCNGFETCQSGSCASGTAPLCNDGNPCTTDGCSGTAGCTHTSLPGCCFTDGDCADNDACTINARCVSGVCTSEQRNCNDANPCTSDVCLPSVGCVNLSLVDGTSCTDGAACDGLETCASGGCVDGTPPVCDDRNFCTTDSCDNALGCRHTPVGGCCNTDTECVDSDQCTVNERCTPGHMCTSSARNCSDGNVCTSDGCSPTSGCLNPPVSGSCNDGQNCTASDTCNAGQCAGVPVNCNDGNFCDGAETCQASNGQCVESNDVVCVPGGRSPIAACTGEWYLDQPVPPDSTRTSKFTCIQGDPACDHDADPESCTFRLAICLRVSDPRLPVCTPAPVTGYEIPRSLLRKQSTVAFAIVSALASLPGATVQGIFGSEVSFSPSITTPRCTGLISIPVPLGRKVSLKGRVSTAVGKTDKDRLKLACR